MLKGKKVLVMGLARSGRSAAKFCLEQGATVTCTDLNPNTDPVFGANNVLGFHKIEDFLSADLIIISPGIPLNAPLLVKANEAGIPILGELKFAASFIDAPIIAITGTNGKSTVTHFTGQLLQNAGFNVFVGGNIGLPLSCALGKTWDYVVVEVSSYQLEHPGKLVPKAATILNLTPDHLARHKTMECYGAIKCRIMDNMEPHDIAILSTEFIIRNCAKEKPPQKRYIGEQLIVDGDTSFFDDQELDLSLLKVPGQHNRLNAAVAASLLLSCGISKDKLRFDLLTSLPHRMEVVSHKNGITWINDSKATNSASTIAGVGGLESPFVLLLGGDGKPGEKYTDIKNVLNKARSVICFGKSGPDIKRDLEGFKCELVSKMVDAVELAQKKALKGDIVVLSPACASFDEFDNFEHRGEVFTHLVQNGS